MAGRHRNSDVTTVRNKYLLRTNKVSHFFTFFLLFFSLNYIMLKIVALGCYRKLGKDFLNSEFLPFLGLSVNSEELIKHIFRCIHP